MLKAVASPAFKGTICLTSLLYDDSKVCGFPYCLCRNATALLYAYSGLSLMKFLIRSLASLVVYWINHGNLPLASSIFFSTDTLNIDVKYVYSRGVPSNGCKSTCGADCSFTNLRNISVMLFCSPATGSFCIMLYQVYCLCTGRMADLFITITPTRI